MENRKLLVLDEGEIQSISVAIPWIIIDSIVKFCLAGHFDKYKLMT